MTDQRTPSRRPRAVAEPEMTHDEVAEVLGITRCRVQQLENRALLKLRKQLARRGITAVDDIL